MNRRNFFATIPALGALPFIGESIEKTDAGILLIKPEVFTPPKFGDNRDHLHKKPIRIFAFQDSEMVGELHASNVEISMRSPNNFGPAYELKVTCRNLSPGIPPQLWWSMI